VPKLSCFVDFSTEKIHVRTRHFNLKLTHSFTLSTRMAHLKLGPKT